MVQAVLARSLFLSGGETVEKRRLNDIAYRQFLDEEKLMGSRCKECGARFVPPRSLCIRCYGSNMEWVEMNGKGTLSAFTCTYVIPPAMQGQGYDRNTPYCSGVVELEEGGRVVARIEGVDTREPANIKVGTPLSVKFLHRGAGAASRTILAFEPL